MSIQRKPRAVDSKAEKFIAGAPDACAGDVDSQRPYDKGIPKGNKRQISLTIAPELLRKVDEVAKRTGQARAAVINMALYRALEGDIFSAR
ncbi:MAG: CopG family transcriptional regulator [Xanthomonadales bacterium]|nr:CopG family transcriptional regulator [Xanthomonadales bacterium]MDL1869071.1 CopG family transcriptional regulator [Gammaproteobacteria bacterium PRO6]